MNALLSEELVFNALDAKHMEVTCHLPSRFDSIAVWGQL